MINKVFSLTLIAALVFFSLFTSTCAGFSDEQLLDMYYEAKAVHESRFNDLESVPWAVTPITELAGRGIVSGTGGGAFTPNRSVSRAEFIKLITSTAGLLDPYAVSRYTDVPREHWAYLYVSSASESGLIDIFDTDTLNPDEPITREDICYMSMKALEITGSVGDISVHLQSSFTDEAQMSEYAANSIYKLFELGVINGRGNGVFSPKDSATRAESAKIIYNVLNIIEENF